MFTKHHHQINNTTAGLVQRLFVELSDTAIITELLCFMRIKPN